MRSIVSNPRTYTSSTHCLGIYVLHDVNLTVKLGIHVILVVRWCRRSPFQTLALSDSTSSFARQSLEKRLRRGRSRRTSSVRTSWISSPRYLMVSRRGLVVRVRSSLVAGTSVLRSLMLSHVARRYSCATRPSLHPQPRAIKRSTIHQIPLWLLHFQAL